MKERGSEYLRGTKAVSPVITTILLVLLVLILASIIVIWGFKFIPEALTKFERPIEEKCSETKFSAELAGSEISIINEGDVPVYRIGMKKEGKLRADVEYSDALNLLPGGTAKAKPDLAGYATGDKIDIIPILLGKTKEGKIQEYSCAESSWQVIEIQ